MIKRKIQDTIKLMAEKMPVISITGPRQSGKTTVAKTCFPDYSYVNLENPDTLEDAMSDPRTFLSRHDKGLIIDEVQRFPDLFSYIQTISDANRQAGEFILTGSQNFLLSEKISQSLAGRVFVIHLLPFSFSELKEANLLPESHERSIFMGSYPRLYDKDIPPPLFYPSYIQTYTERDIRQLVNVSNLILFQRFMKMAAGRVGQMLNYSNLANELGVDLKTVKSWFSILETSFIVFFLPPHFRNFSKRLVKSPKLYFYDTGLVCSLLGIKEEKEIATHWAKGALFENMVMADIRKNYFNRAEIPPMYYWRDNTGNEIDCLLEEGNEIKSIEVKSSGTIHPDFFKGLKFYSKLNAGAASYLVYGGQSNHTRNEIRIISWHDTESLMASLHS